ncbi:hypothetical protein [Sinorhizobium medicae]|uniref:hypothetical protein n=1 Tax=Sinorhizobium medicae TaxID=110321 RepID=UPI000FDAF90D|nr:hypothetical protein [Sinorhizobium medicae]RVO68494.1 hypothetical protein CN084_32970 [Sinorhizobium medicae]
MKIFGSALALAIIAGTMLSACGDTKSNYENSGKQAVAYIQARRDFAQALGSAVAQKQGPVYRLVAISGPQYPVGSALDPANPADAVTTACLVPEPALVAWAPLPAVNQSRNVSLGASLPALLGSASSLLSKLGINVARTSSANWRMEDVAQRLSPQAVFAEAISTGSCAEQTSERDILFVRGVIYAKETFTSTTGFNAAASTSESGGGFRVSADQNGGFKVEDAQAIPRFHIVTLKPAAGSSGRSSLESRPVFVAPSDEVLNRLSAVR